MSRQSGSQFEFGPYRLDTSERLLSRDGTPLSLTPKVFDTLVALLEHSGRLVEKDELIQLVWADGFIEESNLKNNVYALRKLLGHGYIETVPTRGYRFTAPVKELNPETLVIEKRTLTRIVTEENEQALVSPANAKNLSNGLRLSWPFVGWSFIVLSVAGFALYPRNIPRHTENAAPFSTMDMSRITTSGRITHTALSPNGKYVAHVVKDSDGDSLWVKLVDAPSVVRLAGPALTELISVAFAPDSQSLSYVALDHDKGESTVFRIPVLGGRSEIVAEDACPIGFSRDGKQIAFIRGRGTESTLVVAGANGKNQRVVASLKQPDFFELEWNAPAWSPDGKTIAFPASLNDRRGRYGTLLGVNPVSGRKTPLTPVRWNYVGQSVWLPDGSGLMLAASDRPGSPMQVWHIALPGGAATRITHDLNDYHDLSLSEDGRRLAAVQIQGVSNIWVAPGTDASRARQIGSETGSLEVLAWTPAGRLLYRSNAGGSGADIWSMNRDGSDAKQLTVGALVSRGLAVTPDSRYIVFVSGRAGRSNIWRVDTDGGNLRQLTAGEGEFYPQCTPDGKEVVYQSGEIDPRVWSVPIAGGSATPLSEARAAKPAISPDGRKVAYSYLDAEQIPSRWRIGVLSSEEGQVLNRFDFPPTVHFRTVRWSPDGRSIAFINNVDGRSDIWLQPIDGSPIRQLTHFGAEQILSFDWSPDGRFLGYVRHAETSDVVLMEQK